MQSIDPISGAIFSHGGIIWTNLVDVYKTDAAYEKIKALGLVVSDTIFLK